MSEPMISLLCWDGSHENLPPQFPKSPKCRANSLLTKELYDAPLESDHYYLSRSLPKDQQGYCECPCHAALRAHGGGG